jgi:hypothetical protein
MIRLAVILIAIAIVLGGIIGVGYKDEIITYEAQTVEVVKTVEVETLAVRVKNAQDEAKARVETEAKAAYDKAYNAAMLDIELAETAKYRKEIEAREAELEKQSSF